MNLSPPQKKKSPALSSLPTPLRKETKVKDFGLLWLWLHLCECSHGDYTEIMNFSLSTEQVCGVNAAISPMSQMQSFVASVDNHWLLSNVKTKEVIQCWGLSNHSGYATCCSDFRCIECWLISHCLTKGYSLWYCSLLCRLCVSTAIINSKSLIDDAEKISPLTDEPSSLDSQSTGLSPKRPLDETNNNPKKKVSTWLTVFSVNVLHHKTM